MAEHEEAYLAECLKQKICPVCRKAVTKGTGSGRKKDGLFCSLDCFTNWNAAAIVRRRTMTEGE